LSVFNILNRTQQRITDNEETETILILQALSAIFAAFQHSRLLVAAVYNIVCCYPWQL